MRKAQFYKNINNSTLQCTLCNHFCVLKEGEIGKCRVRENKNQKITSLVYGYSVAQNPDPIEKKPLFHFMPGSFTYSIGTFGCNFRCANCQNWDISQAKHIKAKITDLNFYPPKKIIENAFYNECPSIAYTYNEPTVFTEYALDVMKLARANGLKNIWVSNGFMSQECLKAIIPFLDAINVDLKSMDDDFYKKNCQARLQPVLENLQTIKNEQIHLEITTLIIPKLSDDIEMLSSLAKFIVKELGADTPWHISKFFSKPSWKLFDLTATGDDLIYKAYEIGKDVGLKYVYVGNLPGDQKENTYCPKCGELCVRRMGHYIERLDIDGRCLKCDTSLDIIE